jgi:hypothetical protein
MGHVARMEDIRIAYRDLVRKHKGNGPLGRRIRICEDDIKVTHSHGVNSVV